MSVHAGQTNGQAAGNQSGGPQQDQQGGQQNTDQNNGGGTLGILNGQQQQDGQQNTGGDGGNQQQGGQQSGQQGGQQQGTPLTAEAATQLFESAFDRRINAVLREIRQGGDQQGQQQSGGGGGNGQQQQQGSGQQSGNQQQQHTSSGPAPQDVREARSIYREFVADEIQFLGSEERDHALNVANGIIANRMARGDDPDQAGRAAADEVAKSIKGLRDLYERQTLAGLRTRGLLKETQGGPGQQPPPGPASGQPGGASTFAAGVSTAQRLFPNRMPQQQGQQQ